MGVIPASLSILRPGIQATPLAEILGETLQKASECITQHVDIPILEGGGKRGNERDGAAIACLFDFMKDVRLKGEKWKAMGMDDELNGETTLCHHTE